MRGKVDSKWIGRIYDWVRKISLCESKKRGMKRMKMKMEENKWVWKREMGEKVMRIKKKVEQRREGE